MFGKITLSIGLLTAVAYYVDFRAVAVSFSQSDPFLMSIGVSLAVLQIMIHFFRWRFLLRIVSDDIGNRETWMSLFVGFTAGFFTPAQLGEFAGRIASHPGIRTVQVVGLTVIDKFYLMVVSFIFGGTGLVIFAGRFFPEYWNPVYWYGMMFIDAVLIVLCVSPAFLKKVLVLLPSRIRQHQAWEALQVIGREFTVRIARTMFLFTAALYLVIFTEFYFLVNAFGPVPLTDCLLSVASIFFVKTFIVPFSFGDIGIRESASVFFLGHFGTAASVAFNASLVMSFINVILPVVIGAVFILRMKKRS